MHDITLIHTNDYAEACDLRDQGFEPVECAFGQYGSVLGPLALDHHGTESHREGVALRACRDLYGARQADPRFVVTGTPDADAVLAIVALAALVPRSALRRDFYELVDRHDVDPIGMNLLDDAESEELAWFNQQPEIHQTADGFRNAIRQLVRLLTQGLDKPTRSKVRATELNRRRRALEGSRSLLDTRAASLPLPVDVSTMPVRRGDRARIDAARVLVVQSTVWGFDQWYRLAPIVVSFAQRIGKVTVGCPDLPTAQLLLGERGLAEVWPRLGQGWGGRETIGGSPRGQRLVFEDAEATAREVVRALR